MRHSTNPAFSAIASVGVDDAGKEAEEIGVADKGSIGEVASAVGVGGGSHPVGDSSDRLTQWHVRAELFITENRFGDHHGIAGAIGAFGEFGEGAGPEQPIGFEAIVVVHVPCAADAEHVVDPCAE
ncbi:MAG: hypothetical protein RL240_2341, partial [Planctomycetota bacterium]